MLQNLENLDAEAERLYAIYDKLTSYDAEAIDQEVYDKVKMVKDETKQLSRSVIRCVKEIDLNRSEICFIKMSFI